MASRAGFSAVPATMIERAREVARCAERLSQINGEVTVVPLEGSFGMLPESQPALAAARQAVDASATRLRAATTRADQHSDGITRSALDYRRADAEVAALYRALLALLGGDLAAGSPGGLTSSTPPPGTDPWDVKVWWSGLTAEQRQRLITEQPQLIGSLDGVPVDARDQANRSLLEHQRAELEQRKAALADRIEAVSRIPSRGSASELLRLNEELTAVNGKISGVDQVTERLTSPRPGQPPAYLLQLSTMGDGQAIVAVGNPDTARHVVTYVPGMNTELSSVMGDVNRADLMVRDAARVAPGESTAAIVWLGYDSPDWLQNAVRDSYADNAAADLNRFQTGLRATHVGPDAHSVVLGHSYGTVVVGHTAQQMGLAADDLVLVASPGVGTESAHTLLGTASDRVWATRAERDFIQTAPWVGLHGTAPVDARFGGRVFSSDPGVSYLDVVGNHTGYWNENNVARDNFARIITGRYDGVR